MERQTVDFGIDLGTTNSAIARATARGVKIVKNRDQSDTTPSAVAKTASGQVLVGEDALGKPALLPATTFKRLMGTQNCIAMADGTELLPEELSAEVLKDLRSSVQSRFDIDLEHVVVTIPAMFEQPQCEATHQAAALAGLNAVTLLQEPIAAATAYLNEDPAEGNYLVYDLGGGTFDVSIVRLRDGQMDVIAHGGDNYLGGSDFDLSIYDWSVNQIERQYGKQMRLGDKAVQFHLLRSCEAAKKGLSTREETIIDLGDLGLPIAQLTLTRTILETLIEPTVSRTLRLARERITQAELTLADIERILLVGGPTFMPYVRRRLKEELGIPLSVDQDPMTVVAVGAAIHASTMLKPDRSKVALSAPSREQVVLELHYDPVSADTQTTVAGKVIQPADFTGDIRITRSKGDWETGWIPLRNGSFACDLLLEPGATSDFNLSLRDKMGTLQLITPGTITLRNGIAAATPVTPYDYGVAKADGSFEVVIPHNRPLPAVGTIKLQAARTIASGQADELHIYFLEGASPVARDNVQVGELRIRGIDLPRTMREGETIEVRVHMDESRRLKSRVSIPILDLDWSVELRSMIETPNVADLQQSLAEAELVVDSVQEVIREEDEPKFRQVQRDLEQLDADIDRLQQGAAGVGVAERIYKKLSEAKAALHPLHSNYSLETNYKNTLEIIERALEIAKAFEDRWDQNNLAELRTEADRFYRLQDTKGLEIVRDKARAIFWKHFQQTTECWIGLVEYLRENRTYASNRAAYEEWIGRAYDCLQRNDYEGVRLNGVQAIAYLPEAQKRKDRFYDAGLR